MRAARSNEAHGVIEECQDIAMIVKRAIPFVGDVKPMVSIQSRVILLHSEYRVSRMFLATAQPREEDTVVARIIQNDVPKFTKMTYPVFFSTQTKVGLPGTHLPIAAAGYETHVFAHFGRSISLWQRPIDTRPTQPSSPRDYPMMRVTPHSVEKSGMVSEKSLEIEGQPSPRLFTTYNGQQWTHPSYKETTKSPV